MWITRAARAVVLERRLPYQIQRRIDPLLKRAGFRERTIRVNGYTVRVRRATCDEDFVQTQLVQHEYTPSGFAIWPDDTVIDIGGNIGTFALYASRQAHDGRVITVEPELENFRLLMENLTANHCTNVIPVRAAVAAGSGRTP